MTTIGQPEESAVSPPEIRQLEAPVAPELANMTFPVYRHLLSLEAQPRHPEQGDQRDVQPVVLATWDGDLPVGLLVGEVPAEGTGDEQAWPELLSVFTVAGRRREGVGTALVGAFEQFLSGTGFDRVQAVYMTGKPSILFFERILAARDWTQPEVRTVTMRFTPDEALSTPWFGRVRLLPEDYVIFPWTELTRGEREALRATNAATPWIAAGLEPWKHDRHGFDPVSSVGLRYRGAVVGWVINHEIGTGTVRFTCSFMRKDLGRRARILPLYSESIRRLREAGCAACMFITPVGYPNMVRFAERRCAPWASFFGKTMGTSKLLEKKV